MLGNSVPYVRRFVTNAWKEGKKLHARFTSLSTIKSKRGMKISRGFFLPLVPLFSPSVCYSFSRVALFLTQVLCKMYCRSLVKGTEWANLTKMNQKSNKIIVIFAMIFCFTFFHATSLHFLIWRILKFPFGAFSPDLASLSSTLLTARRSERRRRSTRPTRGETCAWGET